MEAQLCIFANNIYLKDKLVHTNLTLRTSPGQKLMSTILVEKDIYICLLYIVKITRNPSSSEITGVAQTEN